MVKKIFSSIIVCLFISWSCTTYQPPPPNLYIGDLPESIIAQLSLEERLLTEDAWNRLRIGDAEKARKMFANLGSGSPAYHVGLGYVYYILDNLGLAEEYYKAAIEANPDMILGHIGLTQIHLDTGQADDAFMELREIIKIEPENSWAKPRYENIKSRKTDEALFKGKTMAAQENYEEAKSELLKALFYSPESVEAHLTLAEIYSAENKLSMALVHLKSANTLEPENNEILREYAETLFQADENKQSLEVFEQLQEQDPENQQISERLETLKNRLGIFELPSQYTAISTREAISKEEIAALIGVKFKEVVELPSGKPPIIVDISTSWASKFILDMTSLGILDVYPNHTFQPKKVITRAEMAEILFRLINHLKKQGKRFIQLIPPEKIEIYDVDTDNYYHRPIILILSYDIMSLFADKTFKPNMAVSGQNAVKLLNIIQTLIE